jgi:muramoyltetrapeptide carboxypeptidase
MGYRIIEGANLQQRWGQYFAGTIEQRVADLHAMFANPEVKAILCARGGYGSAALIPCLDQNLLRAYPKPLIGCSDITSLHLHFVDKLDCVCFYGPMAAGDFARDNGIDEPSWKRALTGDSNWGLGASDGLQTLKTGRASGRLYGGCLSLLADSLGTPNSASPCGSDDLILFIEDVGEKPYRIERLLRQWMRAGKMQRVSGIVFGEMLDSEQPGAKYTLRDVLKRVLEDFPGPVAIGLRCGHVSHHAVTLPLGVRAELDSRDAAQLKILEAATLRANSK